MVHIVSILSLTRYETQVNRQRINIILKELTKSNKDIRALFNITNQLATQVQVQNIVLHLRAMLANLRDCLHFMKQLANHVLEYIDTATTSTLTPHLIPVPDLQQMLYQIESELPPNMHLPIPSSDPLHFYRYLWMHILVEENQFLLLIDVPIQDRAQQIQIYQIINLPVPVGNYSMRYTMDTKYLGVTYDRTKAMDIPEEQFKLCKEANGQFCPLSTSLQPLTNPPSCIAALYTKNSREINHLCELTTKAQPELYLPIPLAPNVWAIISSLFRQQPPVTVICPTRPATSIHISPPIHVLKLEPTCSGTSQHFHLQPKYEDTHIMMNLSIYNANLDIINISSALFRITQHIPSVQQQETPENLAAPPPVPNKKITMELMGEVPQETWYALIDNDVILDLQNKVIHEVLHNRCCFIKWAPMHKQITMLQKLLSHIFEQYADVQDDGYISDEDIEEYPETFMPRPCIMLMSAQGPVRPQQPEVAHVLPHCNTEQRLEQGLCQIRRVLFPLETEPEDKPMPLDDINLNDESVYIPNDSLDWLDKPSPDRHLCIHDEHQDGCAHFRAPSHPDPVVTYDNPSSFMSLQDLEDMNILADIEFSSIDELPDLI